MKIIEDSRNLEPDIPQNDRQAKLFAKKDNLDSTEHCNKDNEAKTSTNTSENNNNEINKVNFFPLAHQTKSFRRTRSFSTLA